MTPHYSTASPCFGICCPLHARCVRYERIDLDSHRAIATCVTTHGTWPGFVAVVRAVI